MQQGEGAAPDGFDELFASHVMLVTGKGGVGKTTVSAALGLAAAASGRRTLLVDVEGRQGLSRAFATQPWDYQEHEFRPGLWGAAIDPSEAVYEYLELFYGLKHVSWLMERTNAIDFVTTAAPGLRDLLLLGKVYEMEARRRPDGRRAYDTIIVDAPPTGRIVPFLRSPEGVTEIVRVGPIRRQAGKIREMLHNPARSRAALVTLLEDMPVTETVDSAAALADAQVAAGPVVANQVMPPLVSGEHAQRLARLGAPGVARIARRAGIELDSQAAGTAVQQVAAHRARLALQDARRTELAATGLAGIELPLLHADAFGVSELELLADCAAAAVGEHGPRAREVPGLKAAGGG